MIEELKPPSPSKLDESLCLETNLLEMMVQKALYPGEPVARLAKDQPRVDK